MNTHMIQFIRFNVKKSNTLTKLASSPISRSITHSFNKYTERSHTCGQLSKDDCGKRVKLIGWVQHARYDNKIIALRDSYGIIQCIVNKDLLTKEFRKTPLHNESIVRIEGLVQERSANRASTGEVEVAADTVNLISAAKNNLPILTRKTTNVSADLRLKYRYLDLRSVQMQHALRFRSKLCKLFRDKLVDLGFVECETPTLFNRTPGGANEFIVPTQSKDQFFSLVQSPQQLKQLLMVGGLDRYFQISRCYRDEAGRFDRQPEFTQVDIELSFTNQNLVMSLIEDILFSVLCDISDTADTSCNLTTSFDISRRLKRITFDDALEYYGTDKPDTRFDWHIRSTSDCFPYLKVPYYIDENILKLNTEEARLSLHNSVSVEDIRYKSDSDLNQSEVLILDKSQDARKTLGKVRTQLAQELEARHIKIYNNEFEFIWVTDFPLFTTDDAGKLEPNHHPFTAPTEDTIHFLNSEPLRVVGQHYDLVLNGQEVAGGSIRIHNAYLQRHILSDVLGVNEETFDYFLDALDSGCPPHGGIAIGLDRLISILLHRKSIKDVIAFPKASSGRDLMTDCPQELSHDVKKLYHIE